MARLAVTTRHVRKTPTVDAPGSPSTGEGPFALRAPEGSEEGRAWLATIPTLVETLCGRWGLLVDEGTSYEGHSAVVVMVRLGVERYALKLDWPPSSVEPEARALDAWGGRGAVRLAERDLELGALLLERLDPTRTLRSVPVTEAGGVAGALIRELAIASPESLPSLASAAERLAIELVSRQRRLGSPVPERWVDSARRLAAELGPHAARRLVHGDLHYGNVLASDRAPWLAIDPKPLSGDPEYSVPELLWTRVDELADERAIRDLLAAIVAGGMLDSDKSEAWTVVRCVDYWLWGVEHGLTEDPRRCERLLEVLVGSDVG
jgi:streptomycin 6-kinase